MSQTLRVSASFVSPHDCAHFIEAARAEGLRDIQAFTPFPDHHVAGSFRPALSPVRFITFCGAAGGCLGGFGLAVYASLKYNLITGGKPPMGWPVFVVAGFEIMILLGAVSTLIGLLVFAGLPLLLSRYRYRESSSDDRFNVELIVEDRELDRARELLESSGACAVEAIPEVPGDETWREALAARTRRFFALDNLDETPGENDGRQDATEKT